MSLIGIRGRFRSLPLTAARFFGISVTGGIDQNPIKVND